MCEEVNPRFNFVNAWLPALGIIEAVWESEFAIGREEKEESEAVEGPGSFSKSRSSGGVESLDGMKGMELDGREGSISVGCMDDVNVS